MPHRVRFRPHLRGAEQLRRALLHQLLHRPRRGRQHREQHCSFPFRTRRRRRADLEVRAAHRRLDHPRVPSYRASLPRGPLTDRLSCRPICFGACALTPSSLASQNRRFLLCALSTFQPLGVTIASLISWGLVPRYACDTALPACGGGVEPCCRKSDKCVLPLLRLVPARRRTSYRASLLIQRSLPQHGLALRRHRVRLHDPRHLHPALRRLHVLRVVRLHPSAFPSHEHARTESTRASR